jgi:hypothetical protein
MNKNVLCHGVYLKWDIKIGDFSFAIGLMRQNKFENSAPFE